MAEWLNVPDSKSGVGLLPYRGFESLPLRQASNDDAPSGAFLFYTYPKACPSENNLDDMGGWAQVTVSNGDDLVDFNGFITSVFQGVCDKNFCQVGPHRTPTPLF